jgi:hypothetical protein
MPASKTPTQMMGQWLSLGFEVVKWLGDTSGGDIRKARKQFELAKKAYAAIDKKQVKDFYGGKK